MWCRLGLWLLVKSNSVTGVGLVWVHIATQFSLPTRIWYLCIQMLFSAVEMVYSLGIQWVVQIYMVWQEDLCFFFQDKSVWGCDLQMLTSTCGMIGHQLDMWTTQMMFLETILY